MDKVLADTLVANLKAADTVSQKISALILAQISLVDCQQKTADRVKEMVAEREAERNKRQGAKWALGFVISATSVIGPAVAIKLCKLAGILF